MMDKRDFKMSANDALRLSLMKRLMTFNLGFEGNEARPFTISWMGRPHDIPENRSRYLMPSLSFEGIEVGRLGFRNKDGFVLTRKGLDEEIVHAIISTYKSMISISKKNCREFDGTMTALKTDAEELMFTGIKEEKKLFSRDHEDRDYYKIVMGAKILFSDEPNVAISYTDTTCDFYMKSATNDCRVHMLSIRSTRPGFYGNGDLQAIISFPFSQEKTRMTAEFAKKCLKTFDEAMLKKSGVKSVFAELRDNRLLEEVKNNNFGYF